MKIIYIHQYFKFPHERGGTRSFDLATKFINSGLEVEIISSTSDERYNSKNRWKQVDEKGLTVHYIYLPYDNGMPYIKRTLVFLQFLWFSTFKLLSLNGDCVLATSTPLTIGIPALIKRFIHKTPYVFEVRDVWPEAVIAIGALNNIIFQKALYYLEKIIYKKARAIVPLSVDMKTSIISRYPNLKHKTVEVIENISEIKRFQKGTNSKESILKDKIGFHPRFSILYAGTFGRVNGISYVVELAEKTIAIDPSIVFILIGEGAEKAEIINQSKNKKLLNKNIFILDSVSKDELPQFYSECSMGSSFVIPVKELWANSANKFFDTLAASKPILINHKGWQKKVIDNDNLGFVLPEKLSDDFVDNFVKYTYDKELIQIQSENALNKAKKDYSLEVAVRKYLKIFNSI